MATDVVSNPTLAAFTVIRLEMRIIILEFGCYALPRLLSKRCVQYDRASKRLSIRRARQELWQLQFGILYVMRRLKGLTAELCIYQNPKSEEALLMTVVSQSSTKVLLGQIAPHLDRMLASSASGAGDLALTEQAIGVAMDALRSLVVGSALRASTEALPTSWSCSKCKRRLNPWCVRPRSVVTSYGEGSLAVARYRCRSCREDFYPIQVLNDLTDTQFTIGARELIATEAADAAFAQASSRKRVHASEFTTSTVVRSGKPLRSRADRRPSWATAQRGRGVSSNPFAHPEPRFIPFPSTPGRPGSAQ